MFVDCICFINAIESEQLYLRNYIIIITITITIILTTANE